MSMEKLDVQIKNEDDACKKIITHMSLVLGPWEEHGSPKYH